MVISLPLRTILPLSAGAMPNRASPISPAAAAQQARQAQHVALVQREGYVFEGALAAQIFHPQDLFLLFFGMVLVLRHVVTRHVAG